MRALFLGHSRSDNLRFGNWATPALKFPGAAFGTCVTMRRLPSTDFLVASASLKWFCGCACYPHGQGHVGTACACASFAYTAAVLMRENQYCIPANARKWWRRASCAGTGRRCNELESLGIATLTMDRALKILLVEDVETDAELQVRELKRAGLNFDAHRVQSESAFLAEISEFEPDIIMSDFSIPGFGGLRALELACNRVPETPFVFVSGTIGEETAVESLKRGATDYVLKTNLVRLGPVVRRAMASSMLGWDWWTAKVEWSDRWCISVPAAAQSSAPRYRSTRASPAAAGRWRWLRARAGPAFAMTSWPIVDSAPCTSACACRNFAPRLHCRCCLKANPSADSACMPARRVILTTSACIC